jgi:hypothetical protein
MEAFFYSLLFAAISSLAFVAYRHHRAFVKIADYLMWAAMIVFSVLVLWDTAVGAVGIAVRRLPEYDPSIGEAIDHLSVPYYFSIIGLLVWSAFISLLRFLPQILELPAGSEADDENDTTPPKGD